jgi:TolB-like protein
MWLRTMTLGVALVGVCLLMGCATYQTAARSDEGEGDVMKAAYTIADTLNYYATQSLGPSNPLIVASFVNVNNLEESSSFGRIIAEQIASRFTQLGQPVIELKLRQNSIFISEGKGEFMLSRDLREISRAYNASAVVVGTYAEGGNRLYVSARIVRPADNLIIAAADSGIPMGTNAMSIVLRNR